MVDENDESLGGILWALCSLTDYARSTIEVIRKSDIFKELLRYVLAEKLEICLPALRILGNFSAGNERQTE